ncbi:unnamed protein product [Peronospora belbahrii]|uniref:Radical SAM core domain-containing protein n=1 Tax=Peronospora belbahrii TaxID=622444 RepID=A0AAU9KP91_9STRA|nr:unnamed protein product [Peronospora belbahrii]CAH0515680.1 unnamed protein product [Peronospora belbahrii]
MEQDKTRSPQLIDQYGRLHTYLRISLTERWNLRCRYCMPENGVPLQPVADLLTSCEIIQATKLFARSGITRIRSTGGEPLLQRDLIELVIQLKAIQGIQSIEITTNGMTLEKKLVALQRAGIDRVNISLDTLTPDKSRHLTRRQGVAKVMKSIEKAQALGFHPLKINCVVQRHFNLDELVEFVAFTEKCGVDV